MIKIEKTIFGGNCAVFRNDQINNNNCGVILPNGNIVLKEMFDDTMYSVGDWAIVSVRFSKYMHSDLIYYGIIDKNMHIVIDPLSKEYFGYEGYLEIEKYLMNLYEEKYGMNSRIKRRLSRTLNNGK